MIDISIFEVKLKHWTDWRRKKFGGNCDELRSSRQTSFFSVIRVLFVVPCGKIVKVIWK